MAASRAEIQKGLAADIRHEYELAETAFQNAVEHAVRCGQLLLEAKGNAQHGEWGHWLDENFPASRRTAQGYMRLAQRSEDAQALAHLGIEGALKQLAAPKEDRAEALAGLEAQIEQGLKKLHSDLPRLYRQKAHEALDYESWEAFIDAEFPFPADHHVGQLVRDWMLLIPDEPLGDYRLGIIGEDRLAEVQQVARETGCVPLVEEIPGAEGKCIPLVYFGYIGPEREDGSAAFVFHPGWTDYCLRFAPAESSAAHKMLKIFPDIQMGGIRQSNRIRPTGASSE